MNTVIPIFPSRFSKGKTSAFSLLELLAVIAISLILMVASGPSISALSGAGGMNKAAADFSGLLEMARSQAMSKQTYVRIAIAGIAPGAQLTDGGVVVQVLCSADGTLHASSPMDMADAAKWLAMGRPLVLRHLEVRDDLNAGNPDTTQDSLPSETNIAAGTPVLRTVSGLGQVSFDSFIQFDPSGQACVLKDIPARQIKIALDKRGAQGGRNPIVLRLSGNTGGVNILRADDEIK